MRSYLGEEAALIGSAYPAAYDPGLGWIPAEGISSATNVWGTTVEILRDGIRSNGQHDELDADADSELVVAVGDSFTFGDQVSDCETWPAVLERLSGRRVLNGGVFGYGMDQSFLRAAQLVEQYNVSTLVYSFMHDDVLRNELEERTSAAKPFFEVDREELVLRNVPVPRIGENAASVEGAKNLLAYSYLVHKLMMKWFPDFWLENRWRSKIAHSDGLKVGCLLLERLEHFAREKQIGLFVLIQYGEDGVSNVRQRADLDAVLKCLSDEATRVVDLRGVLSGIKFDDSDQYARLFNGHMTSEGNQLVARVLYHAMMESPVSKY